MGFLSSILRLCGVCSDTLRRKKPRVRSGREGGSMDRSALLKLSAAGLGAAAASPALGFVPAHNWDRYDWGTAPPVKYRLYQRPFPQYPPEEVLPGSEVVMATTPSRAVVPGYGMGLDPYVTGDLGGNTHRGRDREDAIEALERVPLGQKLYAPPTWREPHRRPAALAPHPPS